MIKPTVYLTQEMIDRCDLFARTIITPGNRSQSSREVSHAADSAERYDVQFSGKLCECASCVYFGQDPFAELQWHVRNADGGIDHVFNGFQIDVKGSPNPHSRFLMYSVKALPFFELGRFNQLLFVRWPAPPRGIFGPEACTPRTPFVLGGTASKNRFRAEHLVAPNGDPRAHKLAPGTWYMIEPNLDDVQTLLPSDCSVQWAEPMPARSPVQWKLPL